MKFIDYLFASRPFLHVPVWSVFLVCLHYHLELTQGSFAWRHLLMMACLSLLAAGAYYVNQIYDYESDRINKKLGFLQKGLVKPSTLIILYVIAGLVAVAASLVYSTVVTFILLQGFVLGFIYSAPPLRLKDRPLAGLLANAYAFGLLVPMTVMPGLNSQNAGLLGWDNPFYFFLAVASVHVMTTLPDRAGDRSTGKRTVAVVLPPLVAKLLTLLLLIAAVWVAWRSQYAALVYLAVFSTLPVIFSMIMPIPSLELLAAKLPIGLLTLLAGYFFLGYLLFIVALVIVTRIYYLRRFGILYPKLI